nr:2-halobenzoate 1,2-dioxygenase component A alpha subunit [Pseudomonas cepacia, 2CBS, Peptide Partial, 20 aa] [Burkholderia cepacia]
STPLIAGTGPSAVCQLISNA